MNDGVLLSKNLAVRTKSMVEHDTVNPIKTPKIPFLSALSGAIAPIELVEDWTNEFGGWVTKFRRLWFNPAKGEYNMLEHDQSETDLYYPLSTGERPPGSKGTRAFATYRGRWEVISFGELGGSDKKELFPSVVYKRVTYEKNEDGQISESPETYVICPGGRGPDHSLATVHVLHVQEKTVSTSLFGSLPKAMSNFGAVFVETEDGTPAMICAPGDIESGTRYPVQRFDFVQEEWTKTDGEQQLIGCPAFVKNGSITVVGGQTAYYVSAPIQTKAATSSGGLAMYGHVVTCLWKIDAVTGELATRVPLRSLSNTSSSAQLESPTVNAEKRFLKQNFSGIQYDKTVSGKRIEFIAVGGMELLGYDAKAVVAYTLDTIGAPVPVKDIFPETPLPLGEGGAVRIRKMKGNDCDLLVCIGGRYKTTVEEKIELLDGSTKTIKKTVFETHNKPWSLNLDNISEGWRNDLFPELPTPRWNAAVSEVVTTLDAVINQTTGEDTGRKKAVDRVFIIGGRDKNGLLSSIEALNLNDLEWETNWPGLDGRMPKINGHQ